MKKTKLIQLIKENIKEESNSLKNKDSEIKNFIKSKYPDLNFTLISSPIRNQYKIKFLQRENLSQDISKTITNYLEKLGFEIGVVKNEFTSDDERHYFPSINYKRP